MPTKRSDAVEKGGDGRRRGIPRLRLVLPLLLLAVVVAGGSSLGRGSARQHSATFSLGGERGHPVLLSFLDTQAEASAAGNPSRSQIVLLKSMDTQSRAYGLRTVIVDAAEAVPGPAPSRTALLNFRFDWSLPPSVTVVADADGSIERAYDVTTVPTTLLVDKRGVVVRRWNRFALSAQLDFAIRRLTGRSVFR